MRTVKQRAGSASHSKAKRRAERLLIESEYAPSERSVGKTHSPEQL